MPYFALIIMFYHVKIACNHASENNYHMGGLTSMRQCIHFLTFGQLTCML